AAARGRVMEQRYGSDTGLGARQIHEPPAETLIQVQSAATADTVSVQFEVPTPDARMRVKVAILFVALAGETDPVTDLGATLYIAGADFERAGFDGRRIPTTDVMLDSS